eukprot:gb/GFBE01077838.1/.p1 GENE.gb/GFBE01077838.1/~~gb/GFBE01077838.1/.p1  ORF type:complete len:136 (+),score=37.14 gb/GFBE01077838.1/:1-408(+)
MWWEPATESCANETEGCPCNEDFQQKCIDQWSSWCQEKDYSCPVTCDWQTEQHCYLNGYDEDGMYDWTKASEICVAENETCPCNADWESQYTDEWGSWCQQKTYPCPVTCAANEQRCWTPAYDDFGQPDYMKAGN